MRLIGNLIWILCGGFLSGLAWWLAGAVWCLTIIGIPVGIQCFKFSSISFDPFGKEVVYEGGAVSFLVNVLWFLISGIELAALNFAIGCLLCLTVIGIPFGTQFFKIAKLALAPFGASVYRTRIL